MKKIPDIPQDIIDAIDSNKLIIFIGAGVSKLYGYPLWNEMARNLIDKCLSHKAVTRSEKQILNNSGFKAMELVTIAYNRLKEKLNNNEAQKLIINELSLEKASGENNQENLIKIAEYLSNYQCPILTTNADISLDNTKYFKDFNIIDNFFNWDKDKRFNVLFHIHGSINNFDGMVFTSDQYAKAYKVDSDFSKNLIKLLSGDNVFLFIGYGANEFEMIRYLLNSKNEKRRNKFILKGYLDIDEIKQKLDSEYYYSLEMELIPYSIEEKGYSALIDVLEIWNKAVTTRTLAHMHVDENIKAALNDKPNKKSIKYIRGLLKNEQK